MALKLKIGDRVRVKHVDRSNSLNKGWIGQEATITHLGTVYSYIVRTDKGWTLALYDDEVEPVMDQQLVLDWDCWHDEALVKGLKSGRSLAEMAQVVGYSEATVLYKLRELGLISDVEAAATLEEGHLCRSEYRPIYNWGCPSEIIGPKYRNVEDAVQWFHRMIGAFGKPKTAVLRKLTGPRMEETEWLPPPRPVRVVLTMRLADAPAGGMDGIVERLQKAFEGATVEGMTVTEVCP